ncbi:hypothetical protein As57867_020789, partial [Aphanomyces stellatus]
MESIQALVADKSVLVLNAGDVHLMPMILERARHVRVVDSKGLQWTQKQAVFERGNPLTCNVTEPVDVLWSNVDLASFEQDDIIQFVGYASKIAIDAVYAFPTNSADSKDAIRRVEQQIKSTHAQVTASLTVVTSSSLQAASDETTEGDVVDVWTDRKMPLIWRDSVYTGKCDIMTELYTAQKKYIASLMAPNQPSSYVEVGCGTSEMGSVLHDRMAYTVGVEINPVMLELASEIHTKMDADPTNYLLQGNALELDSILKTKLPADFWKSTRIVTILMNTFGILPEHIRQGVVDQMLQVAGDDG